MDSLVSNGTWKSFALLSGCKTIGCRDIFRRKPDGTMGHIRVDYLLEVLSKEKILISLIHISHHNYIIRVVITRTTTHNLIIHRRDVKIAFLNVIGRKNLYKLATRIF